MVKQTSNVDQYISVLSICIQWNPPNKGHFGDNINSAVVSFVERLSSFGDSEL